MQFPQYVAVYGTLLSGFGNNWLLRDAVRLDEGKSMFWGTMYSNGGFPILSLDEPTSLIDVEVYRVDTLEIMEGLDMLEGYPGWYDRTQKTFKMNNGEEIKAWIYHQDKAFNMPVVESGSWKAFKNQGV